MRFAQLLAIATATAAALVFRFIVEPLGYTMEKWCLVIKHTKSGDIKFVLLKETI